MKESQRARYHASLALRCGAWDYSVVFTPLVWQCRLTHYDVYDSEAKMVWMQFGPISFSVTHEINQPPPGKVLTKIEPDKQADELVVRGLRGF